MGFRSLPALLIQTLDGLIAIRARVLQIDTTNLTLVQNADNSLTLGATGGGGTPMIYNDSGLTIPAGRAVYLNRDYVYGAVPTAEPLAKNMPYQFFGITTQSIADSTQGTVQTSGLVTGLDTSAFLVGDTVYVGTAGALVKSSTLTSSTDYFHVIGLVSVVDASVGEVLIIANSGAREISPPHGHSGINDGGKINFALLHEFAAASVATPGAGDQNLFIDSFDHKLKRKDSSGVVSIIG